MGERREEGMREEGMREERGNEERGGREGHVAVHRAHLNVVDWVNVFHCVLHHLTYLLQSSVRAQGGHCTPLNQDVALCQQLHCLQSDWLDGRQVRVESIMNHTFSVAPLGPMSLCLLLTNLSLFRTRDRILIMSHATPSSNTRTACP